MPPLNSIQHLVLATHSQPKLAEVRGWLAGHIPHISCAADHGLQPPPETGTSFIENATLKARFVAESTNKWALADDSGLVVPAAANPPHQLGVYTKEFETSFASVDEAYRTLYEAVGAAPATATCVLVLASPSGETHTISGAVDGLLCYPARGTNGFGFDRYFYVPALQQSFGEMTPAQKNQHSHRALALQQLLASNY